MSGSVMEMKRTIQQQISSMAIMKPDREDQASVLTVLMEIE